MKEFDVMVTGGTVLLGGLLARQIFHGRTYASRWLTTGLIPKELQTPAGRLVADHGVADNPARSVVRWYHSLQWPILRCPYRPSYGSPEIRDPLPVLPRSSSGP